MTTKTETILVVFKTHQSLREFIADCEHILKCNIIRHRSGLFYIPDNPSITCQFMAIKLVNEDTFCLNISDKRVQSVKFLEGEYSSRVINSVLMIIRP